MDILQFISQIFTDYTIRSVTLGALALGIVSGTLSAFAVLRKQSLLGDAMSHAALPGVVIAFMLTGEKDPLALLIGAGLASWLGTLLMILVTSQTRIKEDSAMGIVLAVFFSLGVVLLSWMLRQGNANQAGINHFIFGQAAATIEEDVILMTAVGALALGMVALFWKEFKLLSFDPEYGATLGFNIRRLDIVLTTLIVIAVVVGLKTVGVVLMSALIVAPGTAARQWTNKLGRMVVLSAFFGALAGVVGVQISSAQGKLPTGPVIVLCISAIVLFSLLFAPEHGLVWEWVRQQRNRRRLLTNRVLEALYHMGLHHGDPYHPHSLRSIEAAVQRQGVSFTLNHLAQDGLVRPADGGEWALTPKGYAHVQDFLLQMRVGLQPDLPPVTEREEALA